VELDEGLALPVSAVNVLRRRCLEELDALRAGVRRVAYADCTPPVAPAARDKGDPPALRLRLHSAAQLTPGLLEGVQSMSLPLSALAKGLAEGALPAFGRYVAEIPRIFFPGDEARLTRELDTLREMGVGEAWCGSLSALKLASRAGLCCQGGYSLNVANALSVREIAAAGAADCQLSFELTLTDARKIAADIPLGLLAYGRLPAMAVRNCPIRAAKGCELCRGFETLTDRTGTHFPVDCGGGIAEIYNSVPLNLADRMDELRGFDFVTLYFTDEDAAACLKVLEDYRHGRPPRGKWTRGLYYRGVG
jgi:putative protease